MTQRRFGPILGAGVAVVELEADKLIQPAPTGITCYVGKTLKGNTGELIACPTRADYLKKVGGYVDGSELPDAAFDFYNLSSGRGELFVIRLTDGTEVEAKGTFYSRHAGHGLFAGPIADAGWSETKRALVKVTAKNGGRWGGRLKVITDAVVDEATDITATTLDTGKTMLVDEWKGGTLRLRGVTSKTYEIVSNDAAGVITVASDQGMAADLAAGATPTEDRYELVLDTEVLEFPTQIAGTRRAVSVLWKDGLENETSLFGLEVYEDEAKVLEYPNLSLDPTNKWYAPNVINEDTSNFWIDIEVLFTGTITADMRPGNWYGRAKAWASDTLTLQIAHVASATGTNPNIGWVDTFTLPSSAGFPDRVKKQRITVTFTSATAFNVTTSAADGAEIVYASGSIVSGFATIAPPNRYGIGFTVRSGEDAFTAGDIFVIDVLPLPVDEDGTGILAGFLYPDVGSDPRQRFQIKSNTSDTLTLTAAPSPTPTEAAAATGTIDTGALGYPLTLTDTSLTVQHGGVGTVTMTIAAGPHADAAATAAAINTAWQTATAALLTAPGDIAADGGSGNVLLSLDDSGEVTEVGYESFLVIGTDDNADLNLTAGQAIVGTLGDEFRVQAPTELRAGYDGQDPGETEFLAVVATPSESLFTRFFGQSKGLVKVATPGVTTTSIQKAFLSLVEAFSYQYRVEIPASVTDDAAAVAYINDTIGRNDFGKTSFPSYAYVPNPRGQGVVLRTLTGAIHGREALVAGNFQGYHKVAAGLDVTLPNVVRLPTGDRILNEEILNPKGINRIVKKKGNFVLWGARTISLDPAWQWAQQRETMSHYERQFLEEFEFIIFAINDRETQNVLITTFQAFFLPEWQKRAIRGDTFQDAVSIKIDEENNTNLTRAMGDLNAEIKIRLADTVERFVIRIGKAGVFESLA
jgi:hypothetical protein